MVAIDAIEYFTFMHFSQKNRKKVPIQVISEVTTTTLLNY